MSNLLLGTAFMCFDKAHKVSIETTCFCACLEETENRCLPASVFCLFLHSSHFECFICFSQGVFVQLVQANSPAALAGLRFGDQVLQLNGQNSAGWSADKAHKALKAASETRIELVVRDR